MQYKTLIESLRDKWLKSVAYISPLQGCTAEDLEDLLAAQEVDLLPPVYIAFMRAFGREPGGLRLDGKFTFPSVMGFKEQWITILPSSDCFVFLTNYDAFALFFHTWEQNDDPVVYKIDEGVVEDEPGLVIEKMCSLSELFTEWVEAEIESAEKWKIQSDTQH